MNPSTVSLRQYGRRSSASRVPEPQVRKHRPDYWLIVLMAVLVGIGITVVYAISPALGATRGGTGSHYVSRQLIAVALSIAAFAVTARIPLQQWKRWQKPLLILAAVGTLIALITPLNALYPAHRWIRLGGLSLQSVEILKFALVICAAAFMAQKARAGVLLDWQKSLRPLAIAVAVIAVVVASPTKLHGQSDLGSFAVIMAILGSMAVVAGMPLRKLAVAAGVIGVIVLFVITISPYRRERLTSYAHPDCTSSGYQACQALIAVGSGGMAGLGLGRSVQAYGYLPEAQNDSIFAIYAEKFGFIGTAVLLGLFVALFMRLKRIAERAPDEFSRLMVIGILAWLSVQTMINVGAMIGLLPLKGITLPFISYGGTSVLFVGAALGLVFQVSHYTSLRQVQHSTPAEERKDAYESRRDRRWVGRAYNPDSGSRP